MTVISFATRKRRGTTPVRTIIHHCGSQSFVEFIDPYGRHAIPVTASEAQDFENALKAQIGNEGAAIVEFLESLTRA